jgi:nucleoside-diphosphate-sugar epimerase
MKIFLAGATGAVGRLLLPLLVEAGHDVAGMTRKATKATEIESLGGRPIVADAFDRAALCAALRNERPDVVIHQLTDLSTRDFAGNSRLRIEGTRNLVDAARAVGVQRMITQSISWMYVPGYGPAHEDEPFDVDAPDARGHAVAAVQSLEQAVAEMPIGVVLRYGLFYGPGTWYTRDGLTSAQIQRGEIYATDGITSFVHVADAAQAAVQALGWPAGPVNIVDDAPAKGAEWVAEYARLIGAPPPPLKPGAAAWERGASNAKARTRGWRPRYSNWRDGFREVLT